MRFAKWLRAFVDELMRTPYLLSLEKALQKAYHLVIEITARSDEALSAKDAQLARERSEYEIHFLQLRQHLTERIRDKDAVIADLRVRLAIAETDAMRERLEKQKRAAVKPVPDFGGPVAFQDELAAMSLEVDETQEKNDEVR